MSLYIKSLEKDIEVLERRVAYLRDQLDGMRPKLFPIRRPFTYEKPIPNPAFTKGFGGQRGEQWRGWETVTQHVTVELQQFDAKPGLEGKCYDLGMELRQAKHELQLLKEKQDERNSGGSQDKVMLSC